MARHVESVTESGAVSIVATRQGVVELHKIRCRKWSRIATVTAACQGVMEPHRIHRREWSKVVDVTTACQGVMEPRRIHRREWSRVVAVTTACQRVQICRPKFSWSLISTEARMGIICRGISIETFSRSSEWKFGSRGNLDKAYL